MNKTLQPIDYSEDAETLSRFAKALGHPTRLIILKYLSSAVLIARPICERKQNAYF